VAEDPQHIRSFIAIHPPADVMERVARFQRELKSSIPGAGVRWTHPDQIHLTLRFLGDVAVAQLPDVEAALRRACAPFAPMTVRAEGAGCFPDTRRPRVLWVGLKEYHDHLQRLHAAIEQETQAWGEHEDRKFHPHLTLGRIKQPDRRLADALANLVFHSRDQAFGEWQAAGVALMQSDLASSGPHYTKLAEVAFRGG
jgi:RNA 2',3'-cyclic 3'-phosphodiesterase